MLSFQNDFPGTKLVRLEQNYRSTQIILDAANGIIAENTARLGKTLFTEKKGGEPVTLLSTADERDEAERSEEHTSELQSPCNLVCRLLLEKKKKKRNAPRI